MMMSIQENQQLSLINGRVQLVKEFFLMQMSTKAEYEVQRRRGGI